jgi:hypothetical protein
MLDFAFVRERKASAILDVASANAAAFAVQLTQTERAAALAWANAALLAGVAEYGREFAHAPMKLAPESAVRAVMEFGAYRKQIEEAADKVSDRDADDPAVAAYKWELLGSQAVIVTAGAALHDGARGAARGVWKLLGQSMPYAADAVRAMLAYGDAYGVEVIPAVPNKKGDKGFLMALASNLPPMFRGR